MKHDYIPLSQSSSGGRSLDDDQRHTPSRSRNGRRRIIFGLIVAAALIALFFIAGELVEYAQDFYDDDADFVHEYHSAYLPFEPPQPEEHTVFKLTPTQELPDDCRDAYFSEGALCYDPEITPMDVLWTWVNGTDTLLQEAKLRTERNFSEGDPYRPKTSAQQARQYRDNDELRHSMRSALANFRPYTRKFHIVTSDFRMPEALTSRNYSANWRLGLLPQWLDFSKRDWMDEDVQLDIVHHADIFRPYVDTNFNSYAIESQFGHLANISEHFIYLNDDFYMSNPLTPRTFFTSVYGTVLRMDLGFMISSQKPTADTAGEFRSMGESNVLLSNRFGARHRPYVLHEPKAMSLSLTRELTAMWAPQLAAAAVHPFRETVAGAGDVSMLFLMVHFMIERWREALLWTWVIARVGGSSDEWDVTHMTGAWAELGGVDGGRDIWVRAGYRDTLSDGRVKAYLKESGHRKTDKTWYQFSALDGYPYTYMDAYEHNSWPSFRTYEKAESLPQCKISYDKCFKTESGQLLSSATDVFTNIAFRKPRCGDCVIQALVKSSGLLGLEAFLPPANRTIPTSSSKPDGEDLPHLPLDSTWQNANFTLASVIDSVGDVNVREWSLKLLQRYRFVIGFTPYVFVMLESLENTRSALQWIDSYKDASLLCINDDVKEGEEAASEHFRSWQERRWGHPAAWERKHR